MNLVIESISGFFQVIGLLFAAALMLIGFAVGYVYHALEVGFFFGKIYLSNLTETKIKGKK